MIRKVVTKVTNPQRAQKRAKIFLKMGFKSNSIYDIVDSSS